MMAPRRKRLTIDTISRNLKTMEYAVRGKIAIEADRIAEELTRQKKGKGSGEHFPFDHIIPTNIGNPHAVQQKAITWPRQVMALLQLPDAIGIDHPNASQLFPEDAIRRAREMKVSRGFDLKQSSDDKRHSHLVHHLCGFRVPWAEMASGRTLTPKA